MKKIITMLLTVLLLAGIGQWQSVFAEDSPADPVEIENISTIPIDESRTFTISKGSIVLGTATTRTTGTLTKRTDAYGNVTMDWDLTTYISSYTGTTFGGYPTLSSPTYTKTIDHKVSVGFDITGTGGNYSGTSQHFSYKVG